MNVDARRFYLGNRFFYGICWTTMVTVNLVFMVEVAGLDPLQMVLVGTALEISALVFEVPTGLVADLYSRRLSVLIGHALLALSFIILALFPTFLVILATQVLFGLGYTFISGALPAWLADETDVATANRAYVTGTRWGLGGGLIGIVIAIVLAHADLALPMLVGGSAMLLLTLVMALTMPERGFVPPSREEAKSRHAFAASWATFREGIGVVRAQPVIAVILAISVVVGAFSEGFDRLFTPLLLSEFTIPQITVPGIGVAEPVTWWGIMAGVSTLLGLVLSWIAERTVDTGNQRQLTLVLGTATTLLGLLVILAANISGFFAVITLFWCVNGLRAVMAPLHTGWLNAYLPSSVRATVLSLDGQADATGQIIGGPLVGVLAKFVSIRLALTVSGVLVLPALALYRLAWRRAGPTASRTAA